jgi:hypothetical protein
MSGMVIHVSDLSGPTKEYSIARSWTERVHKEFTAQVEKYIEKQEIQ